MKLFAFLRKNKFILVVSIFIVALVIYEMYNVYLTSSASFDRSSYFEIIEWRWMIDRWDEKKLLKWKWDKLEVFSWDVVHTIWWKSVWVVTWGDGSLTRLAWNSKIEIKENYISDDLTQIKVDFELQKWKSWSNVVTFMWKDSYFNQEFDSYIAWVRWTVFEVNLDDYYVYVKDHEVTLDDKKNNKQYTIRTWEIFSLEFLQYISDKVRDFVWEQLNNNLDTEYIKELYQNALNFIEEAKDLPKRIWDFFSWAWDFMNKLVSWTLSQEDLDKLSEIEKNEYYQEVLSRYQKLNFVTPDNPELFEEKMRLKEILINLSNKDEAGLIKYSLYDLNYAINNNLDSAEEIITNFLTSDKLDPAVLWNIMENNLDIFKGLPELKNAFWKNWEILNNIIWVDKIEEHFNNTIKTFEGLKKWAEDWIKATIDSAWEIIEKWWEIINQTWEVMNDVKDNVVEWAADLEGKAKDAIQDWLNDLFNINK